VEKLAKIGEKGQNSQPLSPWNGLFCLSGAGEVDSVHEVSVRKGIRLEDDAAAKKPKMLYEASHECAFSREGGV
jgi:hypothetical protein